MHPKKVIRLLIGLKAFKLTMAEDVYVYTVTFT